jgi:hypothetical protein
MPLQDQTSSLFSIFTAHLLRGINFCQVVWCILPVQQAHVQLYGCKGRVVLLLGHTQRRGET